VNGLKRATLLSVSPFIGGLNLRVPAFRWPLQAFSIQLPLRGGIFFLQPWRIFSEKYVSSKNVAGKDIKKLASGMLG
jgi:hypothetical protein